jgi:NadR type nicotinamide-nucleotide adenylyltransferase
MRRGLVFGKFMPLHRGHQLLIERALCEVDDLAVVVYDPAPADSQPAMPLDLRLGWLRRLYPQIETIVGVEDPQRGNPDSNDPRYAHEYAQGLSFLGPFDRVFTSEPGYEAFAHELRATHVVVDAARSLVPISGTRIRESPYQHRGYLDPLVYASLITKVALVGTESTGKSTLARRLADEYDTLWVHEYGRELWVAQGGGTFADHLRIARRQHAREQAAARHARTYLFCDTNPWTTLHWSRDAYGAVDARLEELVDRTMGDYVWVVCDNDFPWQQDEEGSRELVDGRAEAFQQRMVEDLRRRGIPFTVVSGSVEDRVEAVRALLDAPRAPAASLPRRPAIRWRTMRMPA